MPRYQSESSMFRSVNEERRFYASPTVVWFIPSANALTAGILLGALVGVIAWNARTGGIAALMIAFVTWGLITSWVLDKIKIRPTKPTNKEATRIDWIENDGRTLKILELESVDDTTFLEICKMYEKVQDISIDALAPFFDGSRPRVNAFRTELVIEDLAQWNDPNEHRGGMSLTRAGQVVFRQFPRADNLSPIEDTNHVQ